MLSIENEASGYRDILVLSAAHSGLFYGKTDVSTCIVLFMVYTGMEIMR